MPVFGLTRPWRSTIFRNVRLSLTMRTTLCEHYHSSYAEWAMSTKQAVRLSSKEYLILKLLTNAGTEGLYGLQLVHESRGELARGTVYVTLERMQHKGLVKSQTEKQPSISGLPRRIYQPTGYGAQVFERWEKLQELSSRRGRRLILQPA